MHKSSHFYEFLAVGGVRDGKRISVQLDEHGLPVHHRITANQYPNPIPPPAIDSVSQAISLSIPISHYEKMEIRVGEDIFWIYREISLSESDVISRLITCYRPK